MESFCTRNQHLGPCNFWTLWFPLKLYFKTGGESRVHSWQFHFKKPAVCLVRWGLIRVSWHERLKSQSAPIFIIDCDFCCKWWTPFSSRTLPHLSLSLVKFCCWEESQSEDPVFYQIQLPWRARASKGLINTLRDCVKMSPVSLKLSGRIIVLSSPPTSEPNMKQNGAVGPVQEGDLRKLLTYTWRDPSTRILCRWTFPPNTAQKRISRFMMLCNCAVRSVFEKPVLSSPPTPPPPISLWAERTYAASPPTLSLKLHLPPTANFPVTFTLQLRDAE